MEQDTPRRQIKGRNASIGSLAKGKGSPCHQDDASQTGKRKRYSGRHLPEDIWHHICSFLPLKDAARAARASHVFRDSWRCHPNLNFTKETMGFNQNARIRNKMTTKYNSRVGHILKNHSGMGVKTLHLQFYGPYNASTSYCLDSWLQIAVKPGIEELTLVLNSESEQSLNKENYNFQCSFLSNGSGNSIRALDFIGCAFRPTKGFGCMRSLTSLSLGSVHITGDELGFLLSNSLALERLEVSCCNDIIFIQIPCLLQRLSSLRVSQCDMLQVVESKAPNISSFDIHFHGKNVEMLLGKSLRAKEIKISHPCVLQDARTTLPSSMPNLETLTIYSYGENFSTPMLPSKFLHLKYLVITVVEWAFPDTDDIFSLISFLDASPCLETFDLDIRMRRQGHGWILEDASQLERIPGHRYGNLRCVRIARFCSRKMLVKLTCHILENAPSLECLTLDVAPDRVKHTRSADDPIKFIREAPKALEAIRTCIEGKVPSTAKLIVLEPALSC
uniref:Uncharacterized protein n=1 Tax=Avena sativa TaxID=4498 RepID=A0ACD5YDK2_AVESA